MPRKLDNWLMSYIEYTKGQEAPEDFHLWCGISAIAAVLERGSMMDRGYYKLYPNLFIVLVSDSAVSRKTTALDIIKPIIRDAVPTIHIISHRDSPQGLIENLSKRFKLTGTGAGYIIQDELVSFLKSTAQDLTMVQVLTQAYSAQESLEIHTISRGTNKCDKICVNLLAASTPEWIRESLPPYAIEGGFTGRVLFVYKKASGKRIAWPVLTEKEIQMKKYLTVDLAEMRGIKGEWEVTKDAHDWFEDWYKNKFNPDKIEPSMKSYAGRKHDTVLKLSMIMSAARTSNRKVNVIDMEEALKILNRVESTTPMIMRRLQTNITGENNIKVVRMIYKKGEITYSELLRSLSYCLNSVQVREVLDTLCASDMVEEFMKKEQGKTGILEKRAFRLGKEAIL